MKTALPESWRAQLELPLLQRGALFAIASFFVAMPLSLIWSMVSAVRLGRRVRLRMRPTAEKPWVVSVGNVSVGGTGKSPIVRALARMAFASGFDVAILSRGYGREDAGLVFAALNAHEVRLGTRLDSGEFSDESLEHALLLREEITDRRLLWIGQCRDRGALLGEILKNRDGLRQGEMLRPLVVLLDDGLSQVTLPVHHDVVVWDPHALLRAPHWCLPYGPYRMGWPWFLWAASIPRADLVVWSRVLSTEQWVEFARAVERARGVLGGNPTAELFAVENSCLVRVRAEQSGLGIVLEKISADEWPLQWRILTGLARPHRFLETLRTQAVLASARQPEMLDVLQLPDHGELTSAAKKLLAIPGAVVTSLKDLCRWHKDPALVSRLKGGQLFVLTLEVVFRDAAARELGVDFSPLFFRKDLIGEPSHDSH